MAEFEAREAGCSRAADYAALALEVAVADEDKAKAAL
jgi:hypothetical protein